MRILALLLLSLAPLFAVLIPTERMTDWTPGTRVGVPGGIPNRTSPVINVVTTYGATPNGGGDDRTAIQNAINAATAGTVVFIPAGTYNLSGGLSIPSSRDNITVRGAGLGVTILSISGGRVSIGESGGDGANVNWPAVADRTLIGGSAAKDSTQIMVPTPGDFAVGQMIRIGFADRESLASILAGLPPIGVGRSWSVAQNDTMGNANHMARITAKSGNTLTFSPGVYANFSDMLTGSKVWTTQGNQIEGFGLEDLTVNVNGAAAVGVAIAAGYGCWFKNVKSTGATNYPFQMYDDLHIEVRGCWASGPGGSGTNGAGYLVNSVFGSLFEDNISELTFPLWEINQGSSGNVFAYNYGTGSGASQGFNANHGPHNVMNLYEGNIAPSIIADGFFGGTSDNTIFRNWFHGKEGYTTSFKRMTRNTNLIGNIVGYTGGPQQGTTPSGIFSFGQPNIGNGNSLGTAAPISGDNWADFGAVGTLTTRTSDTSGSITITSPATARFNPYGDLNDIYFAITWNNDTMRRVGNAHSVTGQQTTVTFDDTPFASGNGPLPPAGTSVKIEMMDYGQGFQELDLDVEATAIQKGNWAAGHGYVVGTLGADTIPNSLYLSAKPTYFGNLTWPPFNPVTGSTQSDTAIPAGYRYINGVNPPGGPPDTTAPILNTKVINAAGTQIALGFSETISIGLGGSGGWTLNMTGGAVTVTGSPVVSGSTITWNLSRTIGAGQTGTISYVQPGNGVEDVAGNDLANVTNSTVTNTASGDGVAPTPNPSTFGIAPTATNSTTITMTATTATDAGTPPVQYFFNEVSGNAGGSDSGWQSSSTFTDTGLAAGTQYRYRVQARDSAVPPNVTTFSAEVSATTKSVAGAHPAMPFNVARANIVTP